jgi:hypothetical protein
MNQSIVLTAKHYIYEPKHLKTTEYDKKYFSNACISAMNNNRKRKLQARIPATTEVVSFSISASLSSSSSSSLSTLDALFLTTSLSMFLLLIARATDADLMKDCKHPPRVTGRKDSFLARRAMVFIRIDCAEKLILMLNRNKIKLSQKAQLVLPLKHCLLTNYFQNHIDF